MAKTALAYAKKASYIGKQVIVAVKSTGDGDPITNRQLASVMREANALDVPKVRGRARRGALRDPAQHPTGALASLRGLHRLTAAHAPLFF